jgi:hypothetical protein
MNESYSLFDWFQNGGTFSFVVAAIGILAFKGSIIALILSFFSRSRGVYRACRAVAYIALGLALLTIIAGWTGQQVGLSNTEEAAALVDPEVKDQILQVGRSESAIPFQLSLIAALPTVLMAAAAFAVAQQKKTAVLIPLSTDY